MHLYFYMLFSGNVFDYVCKKTDMKKTVLFLLIFSAIFRIQAQHPHMGFKLGANITNLKFKGYDASDYKAGVNAGLLAHIHLSKQFALQPELFFSMQGGKAEAGNTEYKTNLNYINLPLLLQYMFGDGFRIQAGPQIGFLVSAKQKVNNAEFDVDNNFKAVDFAIPVGISYVSHSGLGVDARAAFGISDINDAPAGAKTFNNGFQLGLFYIIDRHHKPVAKRKK